METENDSVAEETPDTAAKKPKPKKDRKKLLIILGVVAVVLVGAGIGGWTWHAQPTFCNAFCHVPMDSYVEGYFSDDAAMLASTHRAADVTCLECHKATIVEMATEGINWVSGNYYFPLPATHLGTREFCLDCHDEQEIIAATANYNGSGRNPHVYHEGGDLLACDTCHSGHKHSELYCSSCHPDMKPPASWAS